MAERAGFEPALPFELNAAFRFASLIDIKGDWDIDKILAFHWG